MAFFGSRSSIRARPWSPTDISASVYAWYDAADLTTVILNGTNVSTWSDKSLNRNNATQSNTGRQPTLSYGAIGGKPAISFNGSSTGLNASSTSGLVSGSADSTWYIVGNLNGSPPATAVAAGYGSNSIAGLRGLIGAYSTGNIILWQYGSGDYQTGVRYPSSPSIVGASLTGGVGYVFVNGALLGTKAISPVTGTSVPMTIGYAAAATPNQFWNGNLAEILFVSGTLALSMRQNVEGYLAWKWGLQSLLPLSHQFKNQPPRV